jgi:hypothetical protein
MPRADCTGTICRTCITTPRMHVRVLKMGDLKPGKPRKMPGLPNGARNEKARNGPGLVPAAILPPFDKRGPIWLPKNLREFSRKKMRWTEWRGSGKKRLQSAIRGGKGHYMSLNSRPVWQSGHAKPCVYRRYERVPTVTSGGDCEGEEKGRKLARGSGRR